MLKQEIQQAVNESLKSKDQFKAGTLRMLLASLLSKEKEKRYKISKEKTDILENDLLKQSELSDQEILEVIFSEIKKRRDAIALYLQGNRQELADKEKNEIEILQKYLPEQLSAEELEKLAKESIEKLGVKEMKDMGKVMADLSTKTKGRAEGGQISKIVKELLSK